MTDAELGKAFRELVRAAGDDYFARLAVEAPSTFTLVSATEYSIALSARGVTSGKILAEARCVASGKGLVLVLDPPSGNYTAQADFVSTVR